jgi:hypothetical protein
LKDGVGSMDLITILLTSVITVFSLGMFFVSLWSAKTYKNMKLGLVSVAFFVFFVKGVLQSLSLFYPELSQFQPTLSLVVIDLVIIVLLFVATLKR